MFLIGLKNAMPVKVKVALSRFSHADTRRKRSPALAPENTKSPPSAVTPQEKIIWVTTADAAAKVCAYADSVVLIEADESSNGGGPDGQFKNLLTWLDTIHQHIAGKPGVLFPCLIVITASEPLAAQYREELFARGAALQMRPSGVASFAMKDYLLQRFGVTAPDGSKVLGWPYLSAREKERRRKMQETNSLPPKVLEKLHESMKDNDEPVSLEAYQERFYLVTGQEDKLREKYFGPLVEELAAP